MRKAAAERFSALPTAAKLFLILGAALLPIGLGLVYLAHQGIAQANNALILKVSYWGAVGREGGRAVRR